MSLYSDMNPNSAPLLINPAHNEDIINTNAQNEISLEKNSIIGKWLIQSGNNCRYISFITIYSFL